MTRLRYLRLRKGWTQRELSRRAGVSLNNLFLVETGRLVPYRPTLERLALALEYDDEPEKLLEQVEVELIEKGE